MHKAYGLYVHITWHTWRRMRLIRRADVSHVLDAVVEAAERCSVHVHERAVLSNHVHLLVSIQPDTTLASFVRHAKPESARRIHRSGGMIFQWARGYFAESLSRTHLSAACVYIARQHRRHPDLVPA